MPFNSNQPSRKKGQHPWYESALLIAVAGSIIAVIGQLAGTVIPIMFGPQDFSDFSVVVSPCYIEALNYGKIANGTVYVRDLHPWIRSYQFGVYLRALEVPTGIRVQFKPPATYSGKISAMNITSAPDIAGEFPIIIQGIGEDGKIRNTTLYLTILNNTSDRMSQASPSTINIGYG